VKSEWVLGRQGDIRVGHESVSQRHARLTRDGDEMTLEDLGSTNGTYVNGVQIVKKKIAPGDTVALGAHTLDLGRILTETMGEAEYAAAFAQLRDVYEAYSTTKTKLQAKNATVGRFLQTGPMVLMMLLGGLVGSSMPKVEQDHENWLTNVGGMINQDRHKGAETVKTIICSGIGMPLGMLIGTLLTGRLSKGQMARDAELNRCFALDYACPKCGRHFGNVPFEALLRSGSCPGCRSKFEAF
jgi:DNA-directed RNA polymerase subunit RPC12/RpoP